MEAFSLTSFTVAPKKLVHYTTDNHHHHHHHNWCLLKRRNKKVSLVYCQARGDTVKSSGLSSVLTDRSAAVLDTAGSLVLAPPPNGKINGDCTNNIAVVPYTGPATSLVDHHEINGEGGIGIVKFLKGKSFLITGATGFLAKVLIEKILRTVPDVGKIFVLIKPKGKESAMERLKNEVIDAEIFKCLQQTYGKSYQSFMLSKLVPVDGNVCESNLGVEERTLDAIVEEVDVIINSAANTTFDERYDVALDINTGGPSRLMSLAKKCKKLKLFLQVSTAYVNGQRQGRIMEKPFCIGDSIARENFIFETPKRSQPTLKVEDELKLVLDMKESFDDNTVAQKMKSLGLERAQKHGWQDTYVFTKAMGEMLIDSMRGEIPVVIIRPSVIESTYRDPFPGWMEGNRMMDPIVLYYGKGQLTGFLADPNGVLDVVPADMVVNATLAAIAKHGSSGKPETNIYQIASSVVNPLVFRDLAGLLHHHFESMPCIDSKGRPIHVPEMKLFSSMEDFSSHLWTDASRRSSAIASSKGGSGGGGGGAGSANAKLSQKLENICRKSVEQAKYLANIYQPYTFYGGRFDNSNTNRLMECMSEEERSDFGMDVKSIDWKDYISNIHIPGLRRHVMKGRGMCP